MIPNQAASKISSIAAQSGTREMVTVTFWSFDYSLNYAEDSSRYALTSLDRGFRAFANDDLAGLWFLLCATWVVNDGPMLCEGQDQFFSSLIHSMLYVRFLCVATTPEIIFYSSHELPRRCVVFRYTPHLWNLKHQFVKFSVHKFAIHLSLIISTISFSYLHKLNLNCIPAVKAKTVSYSSFAVWIVDC